MKTKPIRIPHPQGPPSRRSGFTLIEVLVVITIILVLATVIFMVTRNIKAKAYQANAINALRQVAAFNVAYYTENNGDINSLRWAADAKEGNPSWVKNTFWGRLQPFMFPDSPTNDAALQKDIKLRLDGLFNTNTAKMTREMPNTIVSGAKIYRDESGLAVPFAFNLNLVPWDKFGKVSSVGDPSQILYFTYGHGLFNAEDGRAYAPMATGGSTPSNNIYYLDDKSALAAFLDGHVESIKAPIPDRRFK